MARTKYVRSTATETLTYPTLSPPLELAPGQVAKVAADVELIDTEPATAKDLTEDSEAAVHQEAGEVPDATEAPTDPAPPETSEPDTTDTAP